MAGVTCNAFDIALDRLRVEVVLFFCMNKAIRKKKIKSLRPNDPDIARGFFWALFKNLEAREGKPHAARVRHILDLLRQLTGGMNSKSFPAFKRLNDALSRYRWRGQIVYSSRGFRGMFAANRELSEDDVWEHEVVGELLKLVQYPDVVSRIRRCKDEDCRELFFATKRADQEFHLGKCRQHFYDSDKERREEKKEYMRDRYAELKRHAQNPRSGVGLRKRRADKRGSGLRHA